MNKTTSNVQLGQEYVDMNFQLNGYQGVCLLLVGFFLTL